MASKNQFLGKNNFLSIFLKFRTTSGSSIRVLMFLRYIHLTKSYIFKIEGGQVNLIFVFLYENHVFG